MKNYFYNVYSNLYGLFAQQPNKPSEKTALLAQPLMNDQDNAVAVVIKKSKERNGFTESYDIDEHIASFLELRELWHLRTVSKAVCDSIILFYFNNPNLLNVLYKIERLSLSNDSRHVHRVGCGGIEITTIRSLKESYFPTMIPTPAYENAKTAIRTALSILLGNMTDHVQWEKSARTYITFCGVALSTFTIAMSLFVFTTDFLLKSDKDVFNCDELPARGTPGTGVINDIEAWINATHPLINTVPGIILFCLQGTPTYCGGLIKSIRTGKNGTYVAELGADVACDDINTSLALTSLLLCIALAFIAQNTYYRYVQCLSEDTLACLVSRIKGVLNRDELDLRQEREDEAILEDTIALRP